MLLDQRLSRSWLACAAILPARASGVLRFLLAFIAYVFRRLRLVWTSRCSTQMATVSLKHAANSFVATRSSPSRCISGESERSSCDHFSADQERRQGQNLSQCGSSCDWILCCSLRAQSYFERFRNIWTHGDFAHRTHRGGFLVLGRSDSTLNPGGDALCPADAHSNTGLLLFAGVRLGRLRSQWFTMTH